MNFLQTSFLLVNIAIVVFGGVGVLPAKAEETEDAEDVVTYVGAVLEYEPYNVWTDTEKGYGVINENARIILDYARQAKEKGADIMVTPEYGLQSLNMYDGEMEKFITFTQMVPDPANSINPCLLETLNENFAGMQALSCGAIDHQMYLVINLAEMESCSEATVALSPWHIDAQEGCPQSGYFFYNTQVVFDRKGTVIARYRKQHLFNEDAFTPGPDEDASAVFLTDFNVLFSLQICFDIVFESPGYNNVKFHGLRDVIMSTAWVDYLPFELADAVQMGWSRGLGTNLLVAGYHYPEKGKLGSGIYREYAREPPVYIYDKDSGNVLLVDTVTTIPASNLVVGPSKSVSKRHQRQTPPLGAMEPLSLHIQKEDGSRKHVMIHENLQNYTKVKLEKGENMRVQACSNDNLCCNLTYQYSGDQIYMLMAYSGRFPVGNKRYYIGLQHCAVVWCKNENYNSCSIVELGLPESDSFGPYNITSSSFILDAVYAGVLHRNLKFIDYDKIEFSKDGSSYSLGSSSSVTDLLVADMLCRWYGNDGV